MDKKMYTSGAGFYSTCLFLCCINPVIKGYSFIGGMVPPTGLKNVDFERFDIDEMPWTSVLTIN